MTRTTSGKYVYT